jgi:predicted nucleic acid-binding protein
VVEVILLDTNVLSEALKPKPSEVVLRWLSAQDPTATFITAITQAEILYGVEVLPAGRRRARLSSAIQRLFAEEFEGRILPFDEDTARGYSKIVAHRESTGRPISQFDAMIAAIGEYRKAALATRNTADFEGCGIQLINPWAP